ncbi:nucleotide sugar dehydrogenase [Ammoniphilus sp. YIM 78166]|uniref:nucleotide sugar dehydrogenase n=1 Tax=Ammoniphilus sp. YIM 78166 TaxID=1644106 RepID=UPI003519B8E6
MNVIKELNEGVASIAIIGLGYVGLPLAVAFSKKARVIGFDINKEKIKLYQRGTDVTNEVGHEGLRDSSIYFTSNPDDIRQASFIIIAVPTPIDQHNNPDLGPIIETSCIVGQNLRKGAIVVYESTVYPGVTEEVCLPILQRESGLVCGVDFKIGYSPERINPGDKIHRLENITKVVSGMDEESLGYIAEVYEMVVEAGVYRAPSIRVAEAAKVIENAQRDINIAFVNELSIIFNRMSIDTCEVLQAASTKWNFLQFTPGLVGGHCIGVDPYYLTYKAEEMGYHPEVILAGRRINDNMGKYVAENIVKQLIKDNCPVKGAKVLIMGVTFKENVPDVRNSKVVDIVRELHEYGIDTYVIDPHADEYEVWKEYGFELAGNDIPPVDAVVMAVNHKEYTTLSLDSIRQRLACDRNVLVDIKGLFNKSEAEASGYSYWRL